MFEGPSRQFSDVREILLNSNAGEAEGSLVQRALRAIRQHLGLQIAYVSEFVGNETVFRAVDAPGLEHLIRPGDSRSLDDVYCRHILDGRLPELIPDTSRVPLAAAMPMTAAVPIGAHVSVPLRLADGSIYGMFCCLGPAADASLNERDLNMMKAFADLTAFEIDRDLHHEAAWREQEARIREVLAGGVIEMLYQPIWNIGSRRPVGFEALSRFKAEPQRPPDQWFAEAATVGLGAELELEAVRLALAGLPSLPASVYLTVNASPATACGAALAAAIADQPLDRLILEITEHDGVDDYLSLNAALAPLRARGLRLAMDDAGAGHSGLQRILQLEPDIIKLDRYFVHAIDADPGKRALAAALAVFAREIGSQIVAEGVETETELATLRGLGFDVVQGFLLGRPQRLDEAVALATGAG